MATKKRYYRRNRSRYLSPMVEPVDKVEFPFDFDRSSANLKNPEVRQELEEYKQKNRIPAMRPLTDEERKAFDAHVATNLVKGWYKNYYARQKNVG